MKFGDFMIKYLNYWYIIILVVIVIVSIVLYWPIGLSNHIIDEYDSVSLSLSEWHESSRDLLNGDIDVEVLEDLVSEIESLKFRRHIGSKTFSDNTTFHYSISFYIYDSGSRIEQRIIVYKGGSIDIDGRMYEVVDGDNQFSEWLLTYFNELKELQDED
jgi:hypothetical protein